MTSISQEFEFAFDPNRYSTINNQASSSADNGQNEDEDEKHARYVTLYKAAIYGDWETAKSIFENHPDALTERFSYRGLTALHVAVGSTCKNRAEFVKQLVLLMVENGLPLGELSATGLTPLHLAARAGNIDAVRLLVGKDRTLTKVPHTNGQFPVEIAASYGHEQSVRYLLPATLQELRYFLTSTSGISFLGYLINDGLYDTAIQVLEQNPRLAIEAIHGGNTALSLLAEQPRAFPSGMNLTFWQHLLYQVWYWIFAICGSPEQRDIDVPTTGISGYYWWILSFFQQFNGFHLEKLRQKQVLQLLESLVEKATKFKRSDHALGPSTLIAAKNGIHEFVAEVIKFYPQVVPIVNSQGRSIFDLAVIHRHEKVYNLIYQLPSSKHLSMGFDETSLTMLHHASRLDSSSKIEKIPGAALQMQRELQWYKEVEKIVPSTCRLAVSNLERKTPYMYFTESHKALVNEGERWMKDTANSYTIVAALIVTMAFAAAFTVPGGNNGDTGLPIFLSEVPFMIFAISNTLGLVSSTTSLLMFLAILTSRYSQEDFLQALPTRLAIGLITLFFSVASMLIAFTASIHIMLSQHVTWIVIPVGILAFLPLLLFAFLQFPLLVEVVYSTFGPSIFGKQSDEILM